MSELETSSGEASNDVQRNRLLENLLNQVDALEEDGSEKQQIIDVQTDRIEELLGTKLLSRDLEELLLEGKFQEASALLDNNQLEVSRNEKEIAEINYQKGMVGLLNFEYHLSLIHI